MTDSAVARLRGILARDMSRDTIDQLLTDVAAEWGAPCRACGHPRSSHPGDHCTRGLGQLPSCQVCAAILLSLRKADEPPAGSAYWPLADPEQPIPRALTEPAEPLRWADTTTYSGYARACLICHWETEHSPSADAAAQLMEQHLVNVHGRGTVQHGTLTMHLDQRTVDSVLLGPIRRAIKGGR